jgi:pilus assembly protein Flp/PilA
MSLPELMARLWNSLCAGLDVDNDDGQGLVEYALILMFVAVVVVILVVMVGPGIGNIYSNLVAQL